MAELLLSVLVPTINGYTAWLFYSVILSRVLGIVHPRANIEMPLSKGRKILGWITLIIFILYYQNLNYIRFNFIDFFKSSKKKMEFDHNFEPF